jgi:thioredoxin 1
MITGIVIGGAIGFIWKSGSVTDDGKPRGRVVPVLVGAAIGTALTTGFFFYRSFGYQHSKYVVEIVSVEQFDEVVLKSEKPVLVDFYATWCPPCRKMSSVVGDLARDTQGRAVVVGVDVDRNGELADRYGVSGIPRFFVFRDGKIVTQFSGIQSRETLEDALLGGDSDG